MPIRYDADTDTLTVRLGAEPYETYEFEAGDWSVLLGKADDLVSIRVSNASRFVARALAAGVPVEDAPAVEAAQKGMVWYGADSSMISAFGYDEAEGILEVAFHRTGRLSLL